jgi:hypothetical protein
MEVPVQVSTRSIPEVSVNNVKSFYQHFLFWEGAMGRLGGFKYLLLPPNIFAKILTLSPKVIPLSGFH